MIRYRLTTLLGEVQVSLPANGEHELATLELTGPAAAIQLVEEWLPHALDDRGLRIGTRTTPHRLRYAMRSEPAQRQLAELVDD